MRVCSESSWKMRIASSGLSRCAVSTVTRWVTQRSLPLSLQMRIDLMSFDQRGLRELITESEDLQADALRDMKPVLADLTEIGKERRGRPVDLDLVRQVNRQRRTVLRNGGFGLSALAGKGLLATGFGAAL